MTLWSSFNCALRNISVSVTKAERRLSSNHGNLVPSGLSSQTLRISQPVGEEIVDQRLARARIGEHARDLLLQHRRLMQFPADRQVQQRVVRNAAPQKERQSRSQLDIGNTIDGTGSGAGGIGLDAEQKIGAHQHALQRGANPVVESSGRASAFIEGEQRLHVVIGGGRR